MTDSLTFAYPQSRQPRRRIGPQVLDCAATNRLLDFLQELGHGTTNFSCTPQFSRRRNKQVNMLRHNHVCPELKSEFGSGCLQRLHKPGSGALSRQELIAAITGKGKLARLTYSIE